MSAQPDYKEGPIERFSWIHGFSFAINITLGVGFLSIPFGFHKGGFIVGFALLAVICLFSYLVSLVICDLSCKTIYYLSSREDKHLIEVNSKAVIPVAEKLGLSDKKLELGEQAEILFNEKYNLPSKRIFNWKNLYILLVTLNIGGATVAYVSFFSKSFTAELPIDIFGLGSENCYILIFGSIVTALTLQGFHEQKGFQMKMTLFRFLLIFFVFVTCLLNLMQIGNIFQGAEYNKNMPAAFDLHQFKYLFGPIIFSVSFQPLIPQINQHITKKHILGQLYFYVTSTAFIIYGLTGFVCSWGIGDAIKSLVTLNYADATFGLEHSSFVLFLIKSMVILFPGIDVISSVPIMSLNLAENYMSLAFNSKEIKILTKNRIMLYRLLGVLPPIFLALAFKKIEDVIRWVGLACFGTSFIFPLILSLEADKKVPLESVFSNKLLSKGVKTGLLFFFTVALIVSVILNLIG